MFYTLFEWVINEVENECHNPLFFIMGELRSRKYVEEWAEKAEARGRWIKYKHVNENIFELKDFFPDPPLDVCLRVVDSEISEAKKYFNCSDLYFRIWNSIYSEYEARKQILNTMRSGVFKIEILRPNVEKSPYRDDRFVSEVEFSRGRIVDQIEAGFLSSKME